LAANFGQLAPDLSRTVGVAFPMVQLNQGAGFRGDMGKFPRHDRLKSGAE
jgi:hypothetical protein